ncbi:MAG: SET domain-containing protein-lysine N-methyltransferase [Chlamydiia bacterium]|nr:SET domain-containing protein-lysine N-methyltransferase [Chlamydiia bacterium]
MYSISILGTESLEIRLEPEPLGRCVFAKRRFESGELIESCPVIVIPLEQEPTDPSDVLYSYTFAWGEGYEMSAIVLGYGSLYAHSSHPNAHYLLRHNDLLIDFVAHRSIEAGEMITINYLQGTSDGTPLWFNPVDADAFS